MAECERLMHQAFAAVFHGQWQSIVYLPTGTLTLAYMLYSLTTSSRYAPVPLPTIGVTVVLLLTIIVCVFQPFWGSWVLLISCALIYPLPVDIPGIVTGLMALAIVLLASYRFSAGFIAVALSSCSDFAWALTNGQALDQNPLDFSVHICMVPTLCFFIGRFIAWQQHDIERRERQKAQRQSLTIAAKLHDYTTNDLSTLIMSIDATQRKEMAPEEFDEILRSYRALAQDALDDTYKVIRTIRAVDDDHDTQPSERNHNPTIRKRLRHVLPATQVETATVQESSRNPQLTDDETINDHAPKPGLDSLIQHDAQEGDDFLSHINHLEARLGLLGMHGISIVDDSAHTAGSAPAPNDELVLSLLSEIYGNIAKYADPSMPYVVSVSCNADSTSIAASDRPKNDGDADNHAYCGLGSGLTHHQETIRAAGGVLRVASSADSWTLAANIPNRQLPAAQ